MSNLTNALRRLVAQPCGSKEELNAVIELERKNSESITKIMEYLWLIHQEVKEPGGRSEKDHECIIVKMTPHEREHEDD